MTSPRQPNLVKEGKAKGGQACNTSQLTLALALAVSDHLVVYGCKTLSGGVGMRGVVLKLKPSQELGSWAEVYLASAASLTKPSLRAPPAKLPPIQQNCLTTSQSSLWGQREFDQSLCW
ncbi:hypothetical protein MHYP_G00047080 [Metynnis hypsauchen]